MIKDWKEYRLGDLGNIITGRTPPSSRPECFGSEFPFITPSDMIGQKQASTTERYLSATGAELLQRNLLPSGSVAVSCIGWQMGKAIVTVRPSFTNQQLNAIIPNELVDSDFLYYTLVPWRDWLLSLGASTGVRTPILNKSAFSDLRIQIPSLPTQRKIATILSAYDDLIENNTRRIAILEAMARLIYREWFVHFRFPGHEGVRLVESELGPVPEGWDIGSFSKIAKLAKKGINPSQFEDEIFAHYSIPAFDNGCMPLLEKGETIKSNKYFVLNDAVLLSKINPRIPRIWLPVLDNNYRAITSTEFLVLIPQKRTTRAFVFGLCSSQEFLSEFASRALGTSTSHQRVKPDELLNMLMIIPPEPIVKDFSNVVTSIYDLIHSLRIKNTNLRRTRDLLLPRLVSGEVDMAALEIATGE